MKKKNEENFKNNEKNENIGNEKKKENKLYSIYIELIKKEI